VTLADVTLLAFTGCNSVRVVAYLPQIWKAAVDSDGAQAVSFMTWSIFLASNITTVAYALVNQADWTMASIFLINTAGCFAVLALAGWRRMAYRRRVASSGTVVSFAKRAA